MNLINFFTSINVAEVIKAGIILIIIFYVAFAGIILRQISLMTKVVEVPIAFILKIVVFIHFFLSLLLLIAAFTIL